jgi:hypothetical protein
MGIADAGRPRPQTERKVIFEFVPPVPPGDAEGNLDRLPPAPLGLLPAAIRGRGQSMMLARSGRRPMLTLSSLREGDLAQSGARPRKETDRFAGRTQVEACKSMVGEFCEGVPSAHQRSRRPESHRPRWESETEVCW